MSTRSNPLIGTPMEDPKDRKPYCDPNPAVQTELDAILDKYVDAMMRQINEYERVSKENGAFGSKYADHVAIPWTGLGRDQLANFLLVELARSNAMIAKLQLRVKQLECIQRP